MADFKEQEISSQESEIYIPRRNRREQKKSSFSKKIFIFFIILAVIWLYFFQSYKSFKNKVITENDLIVKIENGDNFSNLWNKIEELNNWKYWLYLKYNSPDFELTAWNYKIKWGSNITWVIAGLKTPVTDELSIVILEWWNIYDIDKCLSDPSYFWYEKDWKEYTCMFKSEAGEKIYIKEPLIKEGEYIDYVTSKEKIEALKKFFPFIDKQETFEWFLYPDTYKVDWLNFKINEFVIKQLETFESKVYNKLLSTYDPETITDIVNLASIVEKEERDPEEKSTVAWILKKRLNDWWMIWADITVCYPHKLTSKECQQVISKYIKEDSEYNTRTMKWLPKTPIWNPSYETIEATLNDKETDYWFYLHNSKTGKIYYAETNAEHEQNMQYMN